MDLGSFLPGLLAATVLGILSGLGIGGGSLLLLWLTMAVSMDPEEARAISLLFFFPSALLGGIFRRTGLPLFTILPGILSGLLTAALFSLLRQYLPPDRFHTAYGLLLTIIGIRELLYHTRT